MKHTLVDMIRAAFCKVFPSKRSPASRRHYSSARS
jgi:hypothetical protein